MKLEGKKVAIVHDWLVGGGAERVVFELHKMFPEAPVYTSYCSDEWREKFDGKVVTGWLQKWPFGKLRKFIPFLRIKWFESLDLSEYDLVISSSGNGEAFGVKAGKQFREGQTHVCYCHSPTHFYWRHYSEYMKRPGFGAFDPLARLTLKLLLGPLRRWDLKASKRPDYYIANSNHIKDDIKTFYDRDAEVIHPPVDIKRFSRTLDLAYDIFTEPEREGFITVGRLQPYKHFDIIVEACAKLGVPLTVIGRGPDYERLRKIAGLQLESKIVFITGKEATDEVIERALITAAAFIFAAHEDFGITPIEAMAAGTPVIAYQAGGALDYVQPGITGEFFAEQTVESLTEALKNFDSWHYKPHVISEAAGQFSNENFEKRIRNFLKNIR